VRTKMRHSHECAFGSVRVACASRKMRNDTHPVSPPTDPTDYARWLDGIVRLPEGGKLRGVHAETLKREAKAKGQLLRLGKRAVGVRRRFALMLD
jgi:hypothetical protein